MRQGHFRLQIAWALGGLSTRIKARKYHWSSLHLLAHSSGVLVQNSVEFIKDAVGVVQYKV